MTKKLLILNLFFFASILCADNDIALNINSDDVEFQGAYELNSALGYNEGVRMTVDASYLYNKVNSDLFTLGFSGENSLEAAPGLIFGLGFKGVFAEDFMAVPLLGKVRYILPLDGDIPTTSLFTSYAYAPEALTFSDGLSYCELRLEADMEVISNIHIFGGYRNIDTEYIDIDITLNDSFYAGLKLSF